MQTKLNIKRFLTVSAIAMILIITIIGVNAGTTTYIQDSLNRSNGAINASTADNGNYWTEVAGATKPVVSSNAGYWQDTGTNPEAKLYLDPEINLTNMGTINISFKLKQSATNQMTFFRMGNGTTIITETAAQIALFNDGKIKVLNDSAGWEDTLVSYSANVWQNFTVVFNFSGVSPNGNYWVWVNGVKKGGTKGYILDFNQNKIDRIWLTEAGANGYIDEIIIKEQATTTLPDNITIDVKSLNQTQILIANATIDGSTYTTTNGTIYTDKPANETFLYNITIRAYGFNDSYEENWNSTPQTYYANLTQMPITDIEGMITGSTGALVGQTISMNCNYSNPYNFNVSIRYMIRNVNDSTWTNQTSSTYTIQPADFRNTLRVYCGVDTSYEERDGTLYDEFSDMIDKVVTFTAFDYSGNMISSVLWEFIGKNVTTSANPFQTYLSDFLNATQESELITINITDNNGLNLKTSNATIINVNDSTYNYTLQPVKLILYFVKNGTPYTTSGQATDKNTGGIISTFTDTDIEIIEQSRPDGTILIQFNPINNSLFKDFKQYYEFENDWATQINETIEILQNTSWGAYIKVLSVEKSPIEGAIVELYVGKETTGYGSNNITKFGQRITDSEGRTQFWADPDSVVIIRVTKDGYALSTSIYPIGDADYTKDDPLEITLSQNGTTISNRAYLQIQPYFFWTSKTTPLKIRIYGKDKTSVKVNTQYRKNLGTSDIDITNSEEYDIYTYTIPITMFNQANNNTEYILVYFDGELAFNRSINVNTIAETEYLDLTGISDTSKNLFIFIAIIVISALVGTLTQQESMGTKIFFVASLFAVAISSQFWTLSLISGIYHITGWLKGSIKND